LGATAIASEQKHLMANIITTLVLTFSIVTVAQAQSSSVRSSKLRLGHVKDGDFGCGCSLSRDKVSLRNQRHIFISPMDESAYINLNGKTLKLRLVAASKEKAAQTIGDRSWETYSAGSLRVRIDYIVSWLCPPNDEACEVTYYKAVMTVTRQKQKTVAKAIGLCGC
jgi:hypothetical protein